MGKNFLGMIILICVLGCSLCILGIGEPEEVSSDDVVERISKGSAVSFSNIIIKGDLNLSDIDLLKDVDRAEIDSPISITGSILQGDLVSNEKVFRRSLILDNNIFLGNVSFEAARFADKASFSGSTFNRSCLFSAANFLKVTNLRGCIFKDECRFDTASFEKVASFEDVMFLNNANFRGAKFKDDLIFKNTSNSKNMKIDFLNCSFLKKVRFARSRFKGDEVSFREADFSGPVTLSLSNFSNLDLYKSNFSGDVKITNVYFNGSSNFGEAIFNKEVIITESNFNGDIDLRNSRFRQLASFKGSKFNGSAIFEKAEFDKRAQFSNTLFLGLADFTDCIFKEDALFEAAEIKDDFVLNRTKYKEMFIRWENIKHLRFDDFAFLLLIENFRKLGSWSDADQCYYAYRLESNRFLKPIYRPFDMILLVLYGYGTKPERPLFWFVLTIILFGFIFYKMGGIKKADKKASVWDSMFFSATNIASGAKTLGNYISTPSDFIAVGRFQYLIIIEKFLGLILFALFLTSLARTVIR